MTAVDYDNPLFPFHIVVRGPARELALVHFSAGIWFLDYLEVVEAHAVSNGYADDAAEVLR